MSLSGRGGGGYLNMRFRLLLKVTQNTVAMTFRKSDPRVLIQT